MIDADTNERIELQTPRNAAEGSPTRPRGDESGVMLVDCTDCHFLTAVSTRGVIMPADVVVAHGKKRGHTVSVSRHDR